MTAPMLPPPPRRLPALDGLRGVAALVVVMHHLLLTIPDLANGYYDRESETTVGWLLTYTPLHVVWAGTEAVMIFFVLSGLVLALPRIGRRGQPWSAYFPQRALRLYLPVAVAVILGSSLVVLVSRDDKAGLGAWLGHRDESITVTGVARDLILAAGPSGAITPLWSLQWEVLFSLLLPLYLLGAKWTSRRPFWTVAALIAAGVTMAAVEDVDGWAYLTVFAIGVVIARQHALVLSWQDRWTHWSGSATLTAALLLLSATWPLRAIAPGRLSELIGFAAMCLGAAIVVVMALSWRPLIAVLEDPRLLWVGLVSFSLYLVHEPIVIAWAFLLGPDRWGVAIPLALITSLMVTVLFYRLVERPTLALSRCVGSFVARDRDV